MKLLKRELFQRSCTACALMCAGLYIFFVLPPWCFSLVMLVATVYVLMIEVPPLIPYKGLTFWVLASIYPLLSFLLIIVLNQNASTRMLVFLAFVIASSNDVGAYFSGKCFGKNKILPSISPKKTWEGFIGGFLLTTFVLWYIAQYHSKIVPFGLLCAFGIAFAAIGTLGDFFESWLKRKANIKDSGSLLPGHGGLLDRFDSVLFIIVLVYLYKAPLLHFIF